MRIIMVAGTNAYREGLLDWWQEGSELSGYLARHGFELVGHRGGRPFIWSTDLGGVGFGKADLRVWKAAGLNLHAYVVPPLCPDMRIPADDLTIICHSHGLQPVLYACQEGLKLAKLISVGSPVRRDMRAVARDARPNIKTWIHLHGNHKDRWQWFGTLFDGQLGIARQHPLADVNRGFNVGHGDLLRDPDHFGHVLHALAWPLEAR